MSASPFMLPIYTAYSRAAHEDLEQSLHSESPPGEIIQGFLKSTEMDLLHKSKSMQRSVERETSESRSKRGSNSRRSTAIATFYIFFKNSQTKDGQSTCHLFLHKTHVSTVIAGKSTRCIVC